MFQDFLLLLLLLGNLVLTATSASSSICSVGESTRTDCGYPGILQAECNDKGCCYQASSTEGVPWCYRRAVARSFNFQDKGYNLIKNFQSGNSLFTKEEDYGEILEWEKGSAPGTSPPHLGNAAANPQTPSSPRNNKKVTLNEKSCVKTYQLFRSTTKGSYECEFLPGHRRRCQIRRRRGESECMACARHHCCYDPNGKGFGFPQCYRSKSGAAVSAMPSATSNQAFATTPRRTGLGQSPRIQQSSPQGSVRYQTSPIVEYSDPNTILHALKLVNVDQPKLSNSNILKGLNVPSNSLTSQGGLTSLIRRPDYNNTTLRKKNLISKLFPSGGSSTPSIGLINFLSTKLSNQGIRKIFGMQNLLDENNSGGKNFGSLSKALNPSYFPSALGTKKILLGNSFAPKVGANANNVPRVLPGSGFRHPGLPDIASLFSANSGFTSNRVPTPSSTPKTNAVNLLDLLFPKLPNPSNLISGTSSQNKIRTTGSTIRTQVPTNEGSQPVNNPEAGSNKYKKSGYLSSTFEYFEQESPEKICYETETCGTLSSGPSDRAFRRIVGGQWAGDIRNWPWMASFRRNFSDDWQYKHVCGAALISQQWILTAGHCFMRYRSKSEKILGEVEQSVNSFVVSFGTYARDDAELTTQVSAVKKFIAHPKYDFRSLKHDIAVARLKDTITITNYVRPVCLPSKESTLEVGARSWVTGWGETLRVGDHNESKLKELVLPVLSAEECKNHWARHHHVSWICTDIAYNEDSCTGDSGGPLMHKGANKKWDIVGIAIAGTKLCSTDENDIKPGIYTKVAYYREFIDAATNGGCD